MTTSNESNELLTQTWVEKQQYALRITQLFAEPALYAHVLSVIEPDDERIPSQVLDYGNLERGTRVRIRETTKEESFRGKFGFILNPEPNMRGEIKVAFEDGSKESFYAGLLSGDREREFDVVPEDGRRVVLLVEGRIIEVGHPDGLLLREGDAVKVSHKTMQILSVVDSLNLGVVSTIVHNNGNGTCQVDFRGASRSVSIGNLAEDKILAGHDVLLDPSGSLVIGYLGERENPFMFRDVTGVTWDDIAGLDEAKAILQEAIEGPEKNKKLYGVYRKKNTKGAVLFGSPGNGKTMLGKALATAIVSLHGGKGAESAFIYIKGPEVLRGIVGSAERLIRDHVFAAARKHKARYGYPAIIFIDECEVPLKKRGSGISSDATDSIVTTFNVEMDGLEESGAIVILATNRLDILDPAITREGRITRKIEITGPDKPAAQKLFKLYFERTVLAKGEDVNTLSVFAADEFFSEKYGLYEITLRTTEGEDKIQRVTLEHIASAAMIAEGVVELAKSYAITRDEASGEPSGINRQDILRAIQKVYAENLAINHDDALRNFGRDLTDKVVNVKKLYQGRQ